MVKETIDKHQFKITVALAIIVIIFLITTTANFTSWKTEMEAQHEAFDLRQDHLTAGFQAYLDNIEELERRQDGTDITMAEIRTKLSNIESLLVEIRQDLRR